MNGLRILEDFIQDAIHGLRVLRKNPGITIISVITLALGIGATTSIFTLVNAVLLRPLPYKEPAKLVWLTETSAEEPDRNVSWLDLQDWKSGNQVFESIAGYSSNTFTLTGRGRPKFLTGQYVTADYFAVMGVPPALGRSFTKDENVPGGPSVVILSHRLWQQDFGGDPNVIGTTIKLNAKSCNVVGVMPASFGDVLHSDVWVPLEQSLAKIYMTDRRVSWFLYAVARIRPQISLGRARSAMEGIAKGLAQQYPESNRTTGVLVLPFATHIAGEMRPVLLMVGAAVLFLLLIACANIAGLLFVKAIAREREIAVRLALGARRGRVFRQFMAESMVLSMIGGITGLLLTLITTRMMISTLPQDAPLSGTINVNGAVLAFASLVILGTGLVLGLAPAFMSLRLDLQSALKARIRQVSKTHRRIHGALVISEIALAMALLIGAGLMMRSMLGLLRVNPGFGAQHLLTATALLPDAQLNPKEISSFFDQAVESISHLPGVKSAAALYPPPFNPQLYRAYIGIEGRAPQQGEQRTTYFIVVTARSLETMEIPLLKGRHFTRDDTTSSVPVVAIDEAFARRFFPGQESIGKRIKLFTQDFNDANPKKPPLTVIGVVGTVKSGGLDSDLDGQIYLPSDQLANLAMTFVVRTQLPTSSVVKQIEAVIHALNPDVPVYSVRTMEETLNGSLFTRRVATVLLGAFALGALLLSCLGLYGVMSYLVSQRTGEIGVRMALGARPFHVMSLIVGQGTKIALVGVGIGLVVSFALTRLMATLLYGVGMHDPLTCVSVAILLVLIALVACYLPARRAMRVDPTIALRYE